MTPRGPDAAVHGMMCAVLKLIGTVSMILLLAALAGCGDGGGGSSGSSASALAGKSPRQIVDAAADALERVGSYHMEGTQTDKDGQSRVEADVAAGGDLRFRMENAGRVADLLHVDSKYYMRANQAFWRKETGQSGPAALLADKWIILPAAELGDLNDVVAQAQPENLAYCARRPAGRMTNLGTKSLDGTSVIVIADQGNRPGDAPGEISIAATGAPLPLRIVQSGPVPPGGKHDPRCDSEDDTTTAGDLRLSEFDKPVTLTAPKDAIGLEDLQASGTAA